MYCLFIYLFIYFLLNFIDNTQTLHRIKYTEKKEREKKIVAKITIYYLQKCTVYLACLLNPDFTFCKIVLKTESL